MSRGHSERQCYALTSRGDLLNPKLQRSQRQAVAVFLLVVVPAKISLFLVLLFGLDY